MKPYIEKRNGEQLEFAKPNRRQLVRLQGVLLKLQNAKDDIEKSLSVIEEIIYETLKINHELTKEDFDDIMDYNIETYGFAETYEMLQYIIEDVFTQVDTGNKKINPYLQEKQQEKKQETVQ